MLGKTEFSKIDSSRRQVPLKVSQTLILFIRSSPTATMTAKNKCHVPSRRCPSFLMEMCQPVSNVSGAGN